MPSIAIPESPEQGPITSFEDIKAAMRKLRMNKTLGSDGIQAELIKGSGDSFVEHVGQLFQEIWTTLQITKEWILSVITPIYKKGDVSSSTYFRD